MVAIVRVPVADFSPERLDTGFYSQEFYAARAQIHQSGFSLEPIGSVCEPWQFGAYALCNDIVWADAETGVPFIKAEAIESPLIDESALSHVTEATHSLLSKSALRAGDIIMSTSGTVGRLAVLPETIPVANSNQDTIKFSLSETSYDSHFVAAWLTTRYAQAFMSREAGGAVQQHIYLYNFKRLPLLKVSAVAQKYIGDKIRQAERLRAWAKELEQQLDTFVSAYQPSQKLPSSLTSKVSPDLLTDMLTATTYRDHYLNNQKNLRSLGKTVSVFDLLESVTNGFDERTELKDGLPYVKVAHVKPGYIDLRHAPRVRIAALEDASYKQKPKIGDLLLTRKGTFGIAAVVMETEEFLCSSEVFACKPKKSELMPILSWFLNSMAGNMQFWQFSTGTTMPGINQDNLGNIVIPDFSRADLDKFNQIHELRFKTKKYSEQLTETAKFLVEALIEGQLDGSLLIAAQNGLQASDDTLDRSILTHLKTDGVDGAGPPLFADLDQLYDLLAQAEQT
ncbi:hypothetical protein [Methylocaldum sp. GT1BB]|jgi:type I restriction enzyme S subunit|uniref:hypothetical protein n=1 Tax=Methylocaldum sp. GT1BB TaxID=3438963 RepID=UPI003DA0E250